MTETHPRLATGRLWTAVAILTVSAAAILFVTDRRPAPGPSYKYAVGADANTKPKANESAYHEVQRIPLPIEDPTALTVGADGKVYVAGKDSILVLDPEGKELARHTVRWKIGALAVTGDGKILAGLRSRVEMLDAQGTSIANWGDLGERACITSIAADEDNVFVADAGNRVVLRYDLAGNLKGRIGEADSARKNTGFVIPSPYFDVAFDPMGAFWAVNPGKHGLENYRASGEMVTSWYRAGMDAKSFCGCCNPIHIAFLSDGSIVTAEKGINRVKVYGPDTTLTGFVATPEALHAADTNSLSCNEAPAVNDLAVDKKDRILILHGPEKAILVYEERRQQGG
jgi:sugar lactone lactonase YvrE